MSREEAIDIVRSIYRTDKEKEAFATLVPELAESEDEKMIKAIEHILYENYSDAAVIEGVEIAEIVTWLEKQKEQRPIDVEWDKLQADFRSINEAFEDGKKEVIAHPEKYNLQKPAEWSVEDKEIIETICKEGDLKPSEVRWLKSLRPQSQDTYQRVVHTIFGMLKDKDFYEIQPSHRVSLLNDIRVKCKDAIECAPILDEPSWKPSEEGVEAVVHHYKNAHYLETNGKQVSARLKQFDEGAKVLIYIEARKEEEK